MPTNLGVIPMSRMRAHIAVVRRTLARDFGAHRADVVVRVVDRPTIPGITLFSACVVSAKTGRRGSRHGIVHSGDVYIEGEAMSRVARAWHYGPKRTVSAHDFAYVMGMLHNARDSSSAITEPDFLASFVSNAACSRAAAARLPRETTVDGLPAVEYTLISAVRSVGFAVVTAIVNPDFRVELRVRPVPND